MFFIRIYAEFNRADGDTGMTIYTFFFNSNNTGYLDLMDARFYA